MDLGFRKILTGIGASAANDGGAVGAAIGMNAFAGAELKKGIDFISEF